MGEKEGMLPVGDVKILIFRHVPPSRHPGASQGYLSRHPGHCVTDTVITASPHFLQRYGPSPSAALCAMILAPGCENAELLPFFLYDRHGDSDQTRDDVDRWGRRAYLLR